MTAAGDPPAVRRFRRRPLRWAAVVLLLCGLGILVDLRDRRAHEAELDHGVRASGVVDRTYRGGAQVPIRYHNPLTDQQVRTTVYVSDPGLVPAPGRPVDLDVSRRNPTEAAVAGDRPSVVADNLVLYGLWLAVPVSAWLARRWSGWRTRRLMAAPGPSFAMVGALAPPRPLRRLAQLHLYPLDAGPGAEPMCAVPVVTTAAALVGGDPFTAEVKGSPRALGRLAVRAGDRVLWPASRGSLHAWMPRPEGAISTPVSPVPATPPSAVTSPPSWPRTVVPELMALAVACAVLAAVWTTTNTSAGPARRIERQGIPVVAEVIDRDEERSSLTVAYRLPGDERDRRGMAPVDYPDDYRRGVRYPARVDRDDPERARLAAEPYDTTEPTVWGAVPAALLAGLLARRWAWWRAMLRTARQGPWQTVRVYSVHAGSRYGLVRLGQADRAGWWCAVRLPAQGGTSSVGVGTEVQVAGGLEVGDVLAVRRHDRLLPVVGPAFLSVRTKMRV